MYKSNAGIPSEYVAYQHVSGNQILEETVADGLVDVDDTVIDTNDGYGFVKMDGNEYIQENGKRRYRMRSRQPAAVHYCTQCDKSFKYPSKIEEHMRKHTGEKPFLCTTCGARFSQGHVLKAHVRTHQGERPFKCSYCDRSFATVAHRNTHEKTSHHEQYQDDRREQPSTSHEADQDEALETVVFVCPFDQCGFQSPNRSEVEEHLSVVHNYDINAQEEVVADDQIWTEYPGDIQQQPQELLDHSYDVYIGDELQEHMSQAESSEQQLIPEDDHVLAESAPSTSGEVQIDSAIPAYQLQVKKELSDIVLEQYPVEREHFGEGIFEAEEFEGTVQVPVDPNPPKRGKPLVQIPARQVMVEMDVRTIEMINPKPQSLKLPRKRTKQARNLDWIIEAVAKGHDVSLSSPHNRKKPTIHTCQICGKVDKYPSKIRAHMRTHTGEKPFKCEICGMQFAQRTPMRLHMRRHMNQKPFACPVENCDERFVSGALRNLHISKKHLKEKKYVCMKGCGRYFASAKNQRAHEEKCSYNRDLEDDPVYQQLIYEQNQMEEMYEAEEPEGDMPEMDKTWQPGPHLLDNDEQVSFKLDLLQEQQYEEHEEYIENTSEH